MKCIHCGTENNLKDRRVVGSLAKCKSCQQEFVFEPTTMGQVKITDALFAHVLNKISVNGSLFFTQKQFLYQLDQRLKNKTGKIASFVGTYLVLSAGMIFLVIKLTGTNTGFNAFGLAIIIVFNILWVIYLSILNHQANTGFQLKRTATTMMLIIGGSNLFGGIFAGLFITNIGYYVAAIIGVPGILLGLFQQQQIINQYSGQIYNDKMVGVDKKRLIA
jgi:hypothetical protein